MAIISLILFITKPFSLSYLILLLPGAQMYCIMVVALLGARSGHSVSGVHIHSSGSGSHSDPIHSHISSNARVNASVDAYRLYPMPTSPGILKQEQSVNIDKVENDTDSDQEMIKVPQVDADSDLESGLQVKATYHPANSYEVGQ
ncbi:hypothetical protein VKT23_020648 [Stygiomarasmius scandens]|uniref:Uncharacterized protein n=1 Tax=Marasmiellus scandens TaxID=2682957 RepID=A0ABR1IMD7_9AGAR